MATQWAVSSAHSHTSLAYDRDHGWIYVKWCGHLDSEDVIAVAQKYQQLQNQFHCPKILNDKSEVTGDWEEANDWLQFEWLPNAVAAGLRYFAMVLPKDLLDLATFQDLERRFSGHLPSTHVKMFHDLESAARWLDGLPPFKG